MTQPPFADPGLALAASTDRSPRAILFWAATVLCIASTASAQLPRTIYVNGAAGNNSWTGLCQTYQGGTCGPKKTIQAGINASVSGDTVLVANGTYSGFGNVLLTFAGRLITLRSENGPQYCSIDGGGGDTTMIEFLDGEGPTAVLDGFTITHSYFC
jgi:hypothetical protein